MRAHPSPALRVWLLAFVAFTACSCAWALTVPIFSGPDEHNHVIKAAGVVRAQPVGSLVRYDAPPYEAHAVAVPAPFGQAAEQLACYVHRPDVPADCAPALRGPENEVGVATAAGKYPPLYYAIVGLPSLVLAAAPSVYGMRAVSAALSAAFLASALLSLLASRSRRALVAALAVAVTPTVVYLAGMVNPNGMEIAAAVCLWASGLVLLADSDAATRPLVRRAGVSASFLALSRGLSPLWLLMVAAVLLLAAGGGRLPQLVRQRQARAWAAVVVVAGLAAAGWIVLAGTLDVADAGLPVSYPALIRTSVGRSSGFIEGMIGYFGYLDAPAPSLTHYLWWGVASFLVVSAVVAGGRRVLLALAGLGALCLTVPVVLEVQGTSSVGNLFWQGRYMLPLAVGIPLLAAWGAERSWPQMAALRLSRTIWAVATAAHLAAYVWVARRYTVGLSGPLDYLSDPAWSPPLPPVVLLVAAAASFVGVAVVADMAVRRAAPGAEATGEEAAADPAPAPVHEHPTPAGRRRH